MNSGSNTENFDSYESKPITENKCEVVQKTEDNIVQMVNPGDLNTSIKESKEKNKTNNVNNVKRTICQYGENCYR